MQRLQVGVSSNSVVHPGWKLIWKLNIPRSTHLFLWKGCNDILPTKEKLYKRKCVSDPFCPQCGCEVETSGHFLWRCLAAGTVWSICTPKLQKGVIRDENFQLIFFSLCNRLDTQEVELMAVVAQKMWHRRNNLVFGGINLQPMYLLKVATDFLAKFQSAQASVNTCRPPSEVAIVKWSRPPEGWVKLNWDAAVDIKKKIMGVGLVLRDHFDGVLRVVSSFHQYVLDPLVAEAFAARQGIDLCRALGYQCLQLEGDCQVVVKAILSNSLSHVKVEPIIVDIQTNQFFPTV
jgi:hypothetical protein